MPLCVDLDGTLVKTDMLMETLVAVVRRRPWLAFALPVWLARGRPALKRELAERSRIDPASLPYDLVLLEELRRERAGGRRLILATAADRGIADRVAAHLGCFDEVMATQGTVNLKGETKAQALAERFGERGFDYAGNDRFDVPIWKRAREALVAGATPAILRSLEAANTPHRALDRPAPRGFVLGRALRLYQWAKNLLVFVPLLTAHQVEGGSLASATLAFLAFSLVASSVYLVNDLADLEADRLHPTKRARALAAGDLPIASAIAMVPVLLAGAVAISLLLPWAFGAILAAYLGTNLLYSLYLKKVALVDVFVLAGLYGLRILAGAAAIGVPVSHWLLAFSLFAFLSLALAKRYVEVANVAARDGTIVAGRGYAAGDGALLGTLGIVAGYLSVLVFALYITGGEVQRLYTTPGLLWLAGPLLLFWITRIWFLAFRGRLHEDPLLFALRDPSSYAIGLAILAVMVAST